jgi:hypothetical protein
MDMSEGSLVEVVEVVEAVEAAGPLWLVRRVAIGSGMCSERTVQLINVMLSW